MHFTSKKIARELGITVQMPYIDKNIINNEDRIDIKIIILFLLKKINRKNNAKKKVANAILSPELKQTSDKRLKYNTSKKDLNLCSLIKKKKI